ncbi:MAG: 4Fe-4S binding protein [Tissierellales bacterium]|nr:4Fe-4S binding protein [Tissierellales bacterium]MBN2827784.1 4Fe-4S binding protein [Tissierellales bacterium]
MEIKRIVSLYFSPNRGTKKIVSLMAKNLDAEKKEEINLTLKKDRLVERAFGTDDLVIVGLPVYSGRIPSISNEIFDNLRGNGALAVALAVYGNRDYDDALLELTDSLTQSGFNVISAAAMIAKHCLNTTIASRRPDQQDKEIINTFATQTLDKISTLNDPSELNQLSVKGSFPYKERKKSLYPVGNDKCLQCQICAKFCPVDAIDFNDCKITDGEKCILCGSCINVCPVSARHVVEEAFKTSMERLALVTLDRREIELFI